ncbi:hypothetical protein HNP86_001787 [Methanococcus maripaludis]|uniref:Uncharacterized protein n=1 Tax=Methanococcus maripaludis TaxID=39152 RepID=A0A7J9NVC6_METMI|nr:hypothetical protein [Methanococcus maripaludis]MBA2851628.1 hypothetical protein [Methanococcus maripaludis]
MYQIKNRCAIGYCNTEDIAGGTGITVHTYGILCDDGKIFYMTTDLDLRAYTNVSFEKLAHFIRTSVYLTFTCFNPCGDEVVATAIVINGITFITGTYDVRTTVYVIDDKHVLFDQNYLGVHCAYGVNFTLDDFIIDNGDIVYIDDTLQPRRAPYGTIIRYLQNTPGIQSMPVKEYYNREFKRMNINPMKKKGWVSRLLTDFRRRISCRNKSHKVR